MQVTRVYLIWSPYPRYLPSSVLPDTQIVTLPPMIGVTCMCLSVVLLDNTCHYFLSGTVRHKVRCQTFLYCKRETKMSLKLLFIMLNRHDHIIKLSISLYLVIIYIEYMYMCVHMCIMNLHVHVGAYLFSYFLVVSEFSHTNTKV